jgi:hypothetical protein
MPETSGTSSLFYHQPNVTLSKMKDMEVKVSIGYNQILELVAQLPPAELEQLAAVVQDALKSKKKKPPKTPLQELLLKAPTWTEKEYQNYLEVKAHLNQFRSV